MLPDAFVGAIDWDRDEEAIPWVYVSGSSIVSELSMWESNPKASVSLRILWVDVVWCPTSRSEYSFPCPSVEFY